MRGRAAASGSAPDHIVDDDDPFSFPARSRSQFPARATAPNASGDRDSLRALFECTGGVSWRTALGWPSWDDVPRTSRNPFGEVVATNVDDTQRRQAAATAEATASAGAASCCSSPSRTAGGGGSPGNPFALTPVVVVHNGNPFAPLAPSTRASLSTTIVSPPSGDATNTRRATETLLSPTACNTSATGTPASLGRATERLPSPASRGASPLIAAAANTRYVRRSRHRFPSPPADAQMRSVLVNPPWERGSSSLEAGAAWFGVSLGTAGRVTELKLVDNGLVGTLPSALGGLEMLRYLHLGRNALSGGFLTIEFSVPIAGSSSKHFLVFV